MVCSTSAKSSVRLVNTTSFRDCLQFRCMKVITKYPQLLDVSIYHNNVFFSKEKNNGNNDNKINQLVLTISKKKLESTENSGASEFVP